MTKFGVQGEKSNIKIHAYIDQPLLKGNYDAIILSSPLGYSQLGLMRMELEKQDIHLLNTLDEKCAKFDLLEEFHICGFQLTNALKIILTQNQNSNYYNSASPVGGNIWLDYTYACTYFRNGGKKTCFYPHAAGY